MDESVRLVGKSESRQCRYYIGCIPGQARLYAYAIRSHWSIENGLHWSRDVSFDENRGRAHGRNAGQNLARGRRLASTSDTIRANLLGLQPV